MRLIFAADINTIFMSKINILSDDKYEIEGYHPVCQSSKVSNLFIQTFYEEQIKDFGSIIKAKLNEIKQYTLNFFDKSIKEFDKRYNEYIEKINKYIPESDFNFILDLRDFSDKNTKKILGNNFFDDYQGE